MHTLTYVYWMKRLIDHIHSQMNSFPTSLHRNYESNRLKHKDIQVFFTFIQSSVFHCKNFLTLGWRYTYWVRKRKNEERNSPVAFQNSKQKQLHFEHSFFYTAIFVFNEKNNSNKMWDGKIQLLTCVNAHFHVFLLKFLAFFFWKFQIEST